MELNALTLIFVLGLILGSQVVALFVQYRVNRTYKGIGYWLMGSSSMALGFISMSFITIKPLEIIVRISNPLIVLGLILLYIGIIKFFDKKSNKLILISIFILFNLFYYYYMYINNDIFARTIIISATIAILAFMISYQLISKKDKILFSTPRFTASVFFIYGCFYTVRIISTIMFSSGHSYVGKGSNIISVAIISIIASNLWTLGLIIMVGQRLNMEHQLEREKLQMIFNTNINAQLITRLEDGFIVDVNDEFTILTGYSKVEIIGDSTKNSYFWYRHEDRQVFIDELNDKGLCKNMEFVFQRKDGSKFTGMISARVIMIHSVVHIISVIRDITERREFEDALIESEEKYRSILNASPDDITITDLDGYILMASPASKEIFGYEVDWDLDNFIGVELTEFIIPEDVERFKSDVLKMYEGANESTNEYRGIRQDKSTFDIEVNSRFIYNANGLPEKMVFIIRDITKRKMIESKMQQLVQQLEIERNTAQLNAITDSLTGLFNRGHFDKTLRTEFSRLTRSGSRLSLIMLDIDHFKKFNDSYGHIAGDKCLQMVAATLKSSIERETDIVARYGGEEFIIILPDTDEKGAMILGELIRKKIEDLAIPHIESETSKYVTVSVGIITIDSTDLISADQALKLVDEALYIAKEKGRNRCVYSSK